MLSHLFKQNLRQTLRSYALYFFTLVVSSALFFAFLSLTSRDNDLFSGSVVYSLEVFQQMIRAAVLIISLIFLLLVAYINGYMLKQRSREFSIYMILGMEKRQMARQFFAETLLFGLGAVVMGIFCGTFLAAVLSSFVTRTVVGEAAITIHFYTDTALWTLAFFAGCFLLVGAGNTRRLLKLQLVELLHEDKVSESVRRKTWQYAAAFVVALLCFVLVAVVLIYFAKMNGIYNGDIPAEISNRFQMLAILCAICGIFAFYHALSFVFILLRRGNWKNRALRSVLLGNLAEKIAATAKILSISTLAITVAFVAFVILPVLSEISTGFLQYRMTYDLMIHNTYRYIDKVEDIPHIDYDFVETILEENGVTPTETLSQESYFIWANDFNTVATRENWHDLPRLAVRLSDYNAMREMAGLQPVQLADDGFFMHIDYELDKEQTEASITQRTLRLDDGTVLTLDDTAVRNDPIGNYLFNDSTDSVLVFPDAVCDHLQLAATNFYANTAEAIPYDTCTVIEKEIDDTFRANYPTLFDTYESKYHDDKNYVSFIESVRFLTKETNDVVFAASCVRLLGIYAGVLFFIICMTVLALHTTADAYDHRRQYQMLYALGSDRRAIVRMVSRQSAYYFFMPCLVAFVMALAVITSFAMRYGHKITAYVGSVTFQFGVLIPAVLIVLILALYYGATIYSVRRDLDVTLKK